MRAAKPVVAALRVDWPVDAEVSWVVKTLTALAALVAAVVVPVGAAKSELKAVAVKLTTPLLFEADVKPVNVPDHVPYVVLAPVVAEAAKPAHAEPT